MKEIRRRNSREVKKQHYRNYYYKIGWENEVKRVKRLKQELESLGPIPQRENQLIKTVKYFSKIVDIATKFFDEGPIKAPDKKREAATELDYWIKYVSGRKGGNEQYLNISKKGEDINFNNLLLGRFSKIEKEEVLPNMKTRQINGQLYKVEVDYTPILRWLNFQIVTAEGRCANMSQKKIAIVCDQLKEILLEPINKVLEE